jgi:methyl-accepting chemotaxis protein
MPASDGSMIVLQGVRPRPIHHTAKTTMIVLLVVTGLAAMLLLGAMMLLVRRGIRRQVEPLRRTAEEVIASGDRSVRTNITASGEIGALARALDTMLDALADQDVNLQRATAAREEHMRAAYAERRLADQHSRRRTQEMINDTVSAVVAELHDVVEQTDAVRVAADTIDERVGASNAITSTAVERSAHADEVVDELDTSLGRVDDIARLINEVAAQTRLLALNATIEAARAGEAGRGFSVVANEVKSLATATAQSSGEITSTIQTLRRNAGAMAAAISELSGGIGQIDEATGHVRSVSRQQNTAVERLNECLNAAITRIQTMAQLTQQLEQRGLPRVPIHGLTRLRHAGRDHEVRLVDLSESGLRCVVDRSATIRLGDTVEVDVPLGEAGAQPVSIAATVAHHATDELGTEIGLQFAGVPSEVADRIHRKVTAALST